MGVSKQLSKGELMSYLEEMVHMELADSIELKFYEDCQWDGFSKVRLERKGDFKHIVHNYRAWQEEQF